MLNRQELSRYMSRHEVATVSINGREVDALQLKEKLCFLDGPDDGVIGDQPDGDHVLVIEEWFESEVAYDDMLCRWPYPKEAHKFPKGWAESRRLCIAVLAEDRPCILYINRDAYTDQLMMARVVR